ncbi:MAG: hypothetical protein IPH82_16885 [Chloroflexi bacterium]|nr:hypothetical protein [Chloroflexota bacterium]
MMWLSQMETTSTHAQSLPIPVRFDDGINGGLNAHLFDKPKAERQVIQPLNID